MTESRRLTEPRFELLAEVWEPGRLEEPVGDVDAKAIGSGVEPEPKDVEELGADLVVVPVEIRLLHVEEV
jgi:hypothetical protein